MHSIFWFRRDLRLQDNTALYHALSGEERVVPIFIFDTDILEYLEDSDDSRVTFIHKSLDSIRRELEAVGSTLKVYIGKPVEIFKKLLSEGDVGAVYLNHDYEPYAIDRDLQVQQLCQKHNVRFETFKDQVIFEKLEVTKADGKPYTVFTPYKNKWLANFKLQKLKQFDSEGLMKSFLKSKPAKFPSLKEIGFTESPIPVPDANMAASQLKKYAELRNTPSVSGTSRAGVHLRFGTVSVRECVKLALKNSDTFLSELIWREFFMQILFNFPNVVKGPAKSKYAAIKWKTNKKNYEKWCEGKTGYALVDAGMRELNATGFMHNRIRMIAASFLVKNLLIDYRLGEKYFARKLLDFDLSSNNGNWQWVAGTGCDAAPYFRVFSPDAQLEKFDPKEEYVRKWVPEYGTVKYPAPIVDFGETRKEAIEAYAVAVKSAAEE